MKKAIAIISYLMLTSTGYAQDVKQEADFQFLWKCSLTYGVMSTLKAEKRGIDSAQILSKAYARASVLIGQTAGFTKERMTQLAKSSDNEMGAWLDQQKTKKATISEVGMVLDKSADKCTDRIKSDQAIARVFQTAYQQVKGN